MRKPKKFLVKVTARAKGRVPRTVAAASLIAVVGALAPSSAAATRYRFSNVTKVVGIDNRRNLSWGSAWADYDRNGYPDLLVGRHLRKTQFYTNSNGKLTRHPIPDLQKPSPGKNFYDQHSCGWGEVNGDGRIDLYCSTGAARGEGSGPNRLLIQKADGFVERAGRYRVANAPGRARSINWFDFNLDGRLDLFVGNGFREGHPNVLFRQRKRDFVPASGILATESNTLSSSWADWNRDGRPGLLVTRTEGSLAYVNGPHGFVRTVDPQINGRDWLSTAWGDFNGDSWPDLAAVSPRSLSILKNGKNGFEVVFQRSLTHGRAAVWFDVDNDGDLDLFVVQGSDVEPGSFNFPDLLVVNNGQGFRVKKHKSFRGPSKGSGETVSVADYDRDGRLDLFVSNGYDCLCYPHLNRGRPALLRNRSKAGSSALLDLRGLRRNPLAIGARLRVRLAAKSYWLQLTDGVNFHAQSEINPVHIALNRSNQASVIVHWPGGGDKDCVTITAGSQVILRKGTRPCSG